jgi:IMP dehydrogenase
MTSEGLVTAPEGTTLDEAEQILHRHRIEKLPGGGRGGQLAGLITVKDIVKRRQFPNACKDERGRLRVGAAVGAAHADLERARILAAAGADILVVDTAHGHSEGVLQAVARIREAFRTSSSWPGTWHGRGRPGPRGAGGGRGEGGGGARDPSARPGW